MNEKERGAERDVAGGISINSEGRRVSRCTFWDFKIEAQALQSLHIELNW